MKYMRRLVLAVRKNRRVQALFLTIGIVGGVVAVIAGPATPASAVNWCGGLQSYVRKPYYVGGGNWQAETGCGSTSAPHTNMGVGGDLTNIKLCSGFAGYCTTVRCIQGAGQYCRAYVPGGQDVFSQAFRNGVGYNSPHATT